MASRVRRYRFDAPAGHEFHADRVYLGGEELKLPENLAVDPRLTLIEDEKETTDTDTDTSAETKAEATVEEETGQDPEPEPEAKTSEAKTEDEPAGFGRPRQSRKK